MTRRKRRSGKSILRQEEEKEEHYKYEYVDGTLGSERRLFTCQSPFKVVQDQILTGYHSTRLFSFYHSRNSSIDRTLK